jgi:hypothetical protein
LEVAMAILCKGKSGVNAHWYAGDGTPAHRQPSKVGGERATTIKDARTLGLFPSVTSILSVLAKPGLENWKIDQAVLAARANPKQDSESDEYWLQRVREASFTQVEEAADLGSKIHHALDGAFRGEPVPTDVEAYVRPALDWRASVAIETVDTEVTVVDPVNGYAGTVDCAFRFGVKGCGILDWKSRKTKPGQKVTPYDGQGLQLAAYAGAYWGPQWLDTCLIANVYVSTTEPGRVEVCKHDGARELYDTFLALCQVWRHLRGYDPRQAATVA